MSFNIDVSISQPSCQISIHGVLTARTELVIWLSLGHYGQEFGELYVCHVPIFGIMDSPKWTFAGKAKAQRIVPTVFMHRENV